MGFDVVRFDIVTIFPRMFEAPLAEGVVGRGIESGIVDVVVHDLRDFTTDRHRTVDDVPFGGGPGMVVILCGRYEGVDDRVCEHLATEEISIGDYVLSGGELAALVIVDAVSRLVPGVVGDAGSVAADSFARGLLDYPHFTRPADFRGWTVPEVLLSGHHARVDAWRRQEAVRRTWRTRPDLLADATLDAEERRMIRELSEEGADDERD